MIVISQILNKKTSNESSKIEHRLLDTHAKE